jgi:hypothetical protein
MTNPIDTYNGIYKFLTSEPLHINNGVTDITFMINDYKTKYDLHNTEILDDTYYERYMDRCIHAITQKNGKLTTILIPLVFKRFIQLCVQRKLFSPNMMSILENVSDITDYFWITCDTYRDIIEDFISHDANDVFEVLKEIKYFTDSFTIFNNNFDKFVIIMQCLPNIADISYNIIRDQNVLITNAHNFKMYTNIQINAGYKQLIIKLRKIEKERNNTIRDIMVDKTWAYGKIAMLKRELDFYHTPEYKQMMRLVKYSIWFLTIFLTGIIANTCHYDNAHIIWFVATYVVSLYGFVNFY